MRPNVAEMWHEGKVGPKTRAIGLGCARKKSRSLETEKRGDHGYLRSSASKVSLRRFRPGIALISDGYTNGIIGAIITMLTRDFPQSEVGMQYYGRLLASIMLAATAISILLAGLRSSHPHRILVSTFFIAIFSTYASLWSECVWEDTAWLVGGLCSLLFMIGMGVGLGNMPVTVSVSEQTEKESIPENAQNRWSVLFTNTMINMGFVISVLVPLLLCCVIDENQLNMVCAISFILCSILSFLWCQTLEWDLSWEDVRIPVRLALKKYRKNLLGLSLAWFIYDFITFPLVIYSSVIMNTITGGSSSLIIVFGWTLFINLFILSGSVLGAFLVDGHGPKNLMIVGLLLQAIVGFGIGAMRDTVGNHIAAYAIAYGVFLGLGEFGPGNCITVLAVKTAPLAVRDLFYTLAAVSGKVGAFIGVWVFPQIIDAFGSPNTAEGITALFWIGGGLAAVCALVTFYLVTPIVHNSMKAEDKAFHQYLEENGFDMSLIGAPRNEA
ncbi:major facilitator superfamily domain-containing protein [Pisolithus albus]|nr:major facilitator superfamily domain-containing protein [Pisolithus albus]